MTESLLAYDRSNIWHPYASLSNPPPVRFVRRAQGLELELDDGSRLIDAVSSWWCVAHGHNHPAIVEAMRRQSEKLCHVMFGGFTHAPAVELAERLAAIAPAGLDKVFFADSGSISVEVAVKMAIQYQWAKGRPNRAKMLALKGGYHGDTACAMALSDPDGMHTLFRGMMPKHFFLERPTVPFSRAEAELPDIEEIEKMVELHRNEIAGIICEPIFQAANAMRFYHPEYLRELRKLCDEYDILMIVDEIAAGLYRTGPRWAHEWAEVKPDVMTVGKALTGGHITLAATLASGKVAEVISSGTPSAFMHGPTYMANPIACAAAVASLDLFAGEDYSEKARKIECALESRLRPLESKENVAAVRVLGAVGILEMKRLPAADDIQRVIREHGVWLRPFCNFVYTIPPLVSDDIAISRICGALADLAECAPGEEVDVGDFHE